MTMQGARHYGPALAGLLNERFDSPLGPGRPRESVREALERLTIDAAFAGRRVTNRAMAQACLSGVWLYHNYLDESHEISQAIDTPEGSFWHGIMHRREPDYGNAKYWFRRVGEHATFGALAAEARQLAAESPVDRESAWLGVVTKWDPMGFIDLVERCARGESAAGELCREIQRREWRLLFDYCYERATG